MKNFKAMVASVVAMAGIATMPVKEAGAVWIIPVFSVSTMASNLLNMVETAEEKMALINSIAAQNLIDESIRGLPKSFMLSAGTSSGQGRSGGDFAGDRIGEFKGVEAVMEYLDSKQPMLDMGPAAYIASTYEEMAEIAQIQGELITFNALGATWSENEALTNVANEVGDFLADNGNAANILGFYDATSLTVEFLSENNEKLHQLSDVYLSDLEKMIETSEEYMTYKNNVSPSICLQPGGAELEECSVNKSIVGGETDFLSGNVSRLTDLKSIAANANSITSVGANGCKDAATGKAGVSNLRVNEEDHPSTYDAINAVNGAVKDATKCMLDLITEEIEGMPGTSEEGFFHKELLASLEDFGDVTKYSDDPEEYQKNLDELKEIITDIKQMQYDVDKLAMIGDIEKSAEGAIAEFFDNYQSSDMAEETVAEMANAFVMGSGANLGLQGVGTLGMKTSDLPGVTDITEELDDIFADPNANADPSEVASLIDGYLFDDTFEKFKGKKYILNGEEHDYCDANGCDISKIESARQHIANEMLFNANFYNLAESMTAYSVVDGSSLDRMEGINNMKTNAEGVQDSLVALYVAKKEALRSMIANNYLQASELYKDTAYKSAVIVSGRR